MKKISPQDSERLGVLLKEMGKIFNRYEIPSLIAFEIDEKRAFLVVLAALVMIPICL